MLLRHVIVSHISKVEMDRLLTVEGVDDWKKLKRMGKDSGQVPHSNFYSVALSVFVV